MSRPDTAAILLLQVLTPVERAAPAPLRPRPSRPRIGCRQRPSILLCMALIRLRPRPQRSAAGIVSRQRGPL